MANTDNVAGVSRGLKGLQSSKMSRRNFFNFLADINIEELYSKAKPIESSEPKTNIIDDTPKIVPSEVEQKIELSTSDKTLEVKDNNTNGFDDELIKEEEEIKCGACMKTFATKASMKRHQERFTVCKDWIDLPQKIDINKLTKGIHLIIDELLDKSISDGELECKFCKAKFTTKGNHHKHFNSATVCNRLAYKEFKKLFDNL